MAGPAVLKIDIIADATKALKSMGMVEDKANGGMGMTKLGKTIVGAVGTGAILRFGKDSVSAASDAAVSAARLETVFASMGDTTGEAAKSAEDYASALSMKIGVDDDSIMAAQAQLATFGAVSDETARAAGIFNRATDAAADLAAAGFGTLDANSVQLGKALQDPKKGLAALAKSGVTFTDQQKDQIAAMQESGDLLGAQKVVLGAIEQQVKGTAAATATSGDKMAIAYGEVQESIGAGLLPVLDMLAPVVQTLSTFIQENISWLGPLALAIGGVVLAVKAWNIVQGIFNVVMAANPIVLVVLAIAALVAAVILAYNKIDWFRDFVDAAFDDVVAAFNFVRDTAVSVFNWVKSNWPLLAAILAGPFGLAVLVIVRHWDDIKGAAVGVWNWLQNTWDDVTRFITGPITTAKDIVLGLWDNIKGGATGVYEWIRDKFDAIAGAIGSVLGGIKTAVGNVVDAIKNPINAVIRGWNGLEFTVPTIDTHIPGVGKIGGATIGFPNLPLLADGGTVLRTGLAVVHAGEQFSGVGRSFGSTTIVVNVTTQGLGADSPEIQRGVVNALRGHVARNGPLDIPVRSGA